MNRLLILQNLFSDKKQQQKKQQQQQQQQQKKKKKKNQNVDCYNFAWRLRIDNQNRYA